jgi:precorrin-8X/cobalt-precorrin-8 methylmutase
LAPLDYLRESAAISARSFALARELTDLGGLPEVLHPLALRLVHACGRPEIAPDIAYDGDVVAAGRAALAAGATVLCDARMVEVGILWDRLPPACRTFCAIDDQRTRKLAEEMGTTRSAAGVELWRPHLEGAVVAIGNAPTALFHLLERLEEWPERPAAIFAFPVGLVGATESKEALIAAGLGVSYVTLRGRSGGSALAAAAVNALLLPG